MIKINNRNSIRILLILSFILLNLAILFGISKTLGYLNSGADRVSMLHLEEKAAPTYRPKVTWQLGENMGRVLTKNILKTIENDYLFSWYVKNKAFEDYKKQGIADYYTQNTRVNLYKALTNNQKRNIKIESTTLKHNPKIFFFSEDGQQVVFTDKNVIAFQKIYKSNELVATIQDTASYKVMMLLEDGFWRVRHFLRIKQEPFEKDSLQQQKDFTTAGKNIKYKNENFIIKGINYYPKNAAWDTFGKTFNAKNIAKDFDIIKKAKLNSIRIFIQYEDFGKADIQEEKLQRLKILLDLAVAKDLKVVVTLFDFYSDYTLDSWTLTQRHAEKIVTTFKNHPSILAWDVKNEPNLDFEARKKDNVLNWLSQMVTLIKETDPNHFVTIGWSDAQAATYLKDKVDIISYHFYKPIENFEKEQHALEQATKKPVVVQEFGVPSYRGIWNWTGNTEADQAAYHKKMQTLFKKQQLSFISWTLYDFPKVPDQVAGKWPWQKNRQKKFGFININGKKKEAFKHITY
jgi:Cellulase (glycosyl hydrolase family 5)